MITGPIPARRWPIGVWAMYVAWSMRDDAAVIPGVVWLPRIDGMGGRR